MVRRNSIEASTRSSLVESELIRGSESPYQADLKFLRGCYSRLIHTTEEQSEKCVSMAAILLEVKKTLSQISNQLGIHTIEAESSHQTPPVTFSASYVRDDQNRLPTTDEHTEKFDSMEALLREMKQAPSIEMPEFDASNVSDWLSKVERSFPARRYSDLDRLDLVAFSLEGDVLLWFASEMSRSEFHSWDEFRRRLFLRFAATPEASSETVTESLEARASYQVPVSSLEPGLSFSSESLGVLGARPSEIVSNNRVHSQSVLECVKNKANAYQVFDKTSLPKDRLKPKNKRKLSSSLKTWMFKFKNKLLQRKSTSKKRKSLDVKFFSVEEIVAGCEKKLFDRFQTSPSYALDVVTKTSKPWETHTPFTSTPVASVNSLSFAVDNFELCVGHDKDIMRLKLLLHSGCDGKNLPELDFHFGVNHGLLVFPWNLMLLEFLLFLHLEDKVCLSAASKNCYGWMVFDRGKNIKILGDVITLKRDDQTMLVVKAKDVHVDSLVVRMKFILSCGVIALRKQIQWPEIQRFSLYKELWIEIMDGDITKLLNSTGGKHTISALELYLISVFSTVTSANSGWLQTLLERVVQGDDAALLEQVLQGNDEAYTKIFDKLQLNLKQGMDLHGASGHRVFFRQQKSSSIWHRWRRRNWDLEVQLRERNLVLLQIQHNLHNAQAIMTKNDDTKHHMVEFWMFSNDLVQLSPFSKLEDKLVFEGPSIDTTQQTYHRKNKKKMAVEVDVVARLWDLKEALG